MWQNNEYLTRRLFTFMTKSRWFLIRMRNVSNNIYVGNQNTHFTFRKFFFFENRAVYDVISKNVVEAERPKKI